LDNLADKNRVDGGVANVVGSVHFDDHLFTLHPVAQMESFKNYIEFRRQRFFRFQERLAC